MERVADLLEKGCYIETACAAVGIHPSTFHRWMSDAEREAAPMLLREFREAVARSSASVEVRALEAWQRAFAKDWRSAASFLERRFPERWGARAAVPRAAELAARAGGDDAPPEFATEDEETAWWAERGYYPRPPSFMVFDAGAWRSPKSAQSSADLPRDSRGRRLWPGLVTLDLLSAEERHVFEATGVAPWEVERGLRDEPEPRRDAPTSRVIVPSFRNSEATP